MSGKSVYTSRIRSLPSQKVGALVTYTENKMDQETFDKQMTRKREKYGKNLLDWPAEARAWYRSVKITKGKK